MRAVDRPSMSVVVPVYNEEEAIAAIIPARRGCLDAHEIPYEIVVVDNASEDRTLELLRPLLDAPRVRLLQ